jgi:UDP-N-acetyl-D-galactosamine dehydrogenase
MIKANKQINGAKVAIFGVAFKENCPDVRNTKVVDVMKELEEYGVEVKVVDPVADREDLWHEYRINPCEMEEIKEMDAVIFAVPHEEFKEISLKDIKMMSRSSAENINLEVMSEIAATTEFEVEVDQSNCVLVDIKGMFNRTEAEQMGFLYWRL